MGSRARLIVPPNDPDVERALLGCLLQRPQLLAELPIEDAHWYSQRHRVVCRELRRLEVQEPADIIALRSASEKAGHVLEAEWFLELWTQAIERGYSARECFAVLEHLRRRRQLLLGATMLEELAMESGADLETGLPPALEPLRNALFPRGPVKPVTLPGALPDHVVELQRPSAVDARAEVRSGFAALDDVCALLRGSLTILAARPSMGKSALAQQIAWHVGRNGGVLFVSAEMNRRELMDRYLAQTTNVSLHDLRRGRLQPADWRRVEQAAATAPPFVILDDTAEQTLERVVASVRWCALQRPLDLVVVDYLQLLQLPGDRRGRDETRAQAIGRATKALKALAGSLHCAVLVVSQLNRDSEKRTNKRPELADLRDSGEIEQDADVVLLLHRPGYYDAEDTSGAAELLVAKARNGPTGLRRLVWDGSCVRFFDRGRPSEPPPEPVLWQ